jgi:hypothetical protein
MKKVFIAIVSLSPLSLFAAEKLGETKLLVCALLGVVNNLILVAAAAALLFFFWGVAKFILHASNEKEITSGKEFMMYGVFALFALISFKAIIIFFSGQFEFGDPQDPKKFLPETVEYNV